MYKLKMKLKFKTAFLMTGLILYITICTGQTSFNCVTPFLKLFLACDCPLDYTDTTKELFFSSI